MASIELIEIELTRQELETIISQFFTYMKELCNTDVINSAHDENLNLKELAIMAMAIQVQETFIESLRSAKQKHYEVFLSEPQAITLFMLLRRLPINSQNEYLSTLRKQLMENLEKKLWD